MVIVLPFVVAQLRQGTHFQPANDRVSIRSEFWSLGITSVAVQIFGNVAFQVALSIVGLTISVPLVLATMLIAGAASGKLMLGEVVSSRKIASILVLIPASVILSFSAATANVSDAADSNVGMILFGVAANIAAGIAYALQGTLMRRSMQRGVSAWTTLLLINSVGVTFLLGWSLWQLGPSAILATSWDQLKIMLLAGGLNALAFMAMAKSLQHVSVLYVQLLNASQAAISALAGWMFFSEPITKMIFLGILLTSVGLVIAGVKDDATTDKPPSDDKA